MPQPLLQRFTVVCVVGLSSCVRFPNTDSSPLPTPWPHERSDLRPDSAVVWGRLENGLRYAILPNRTPPQRASVLLLVQAGSHHERDDERGYAHFIEHLAFRDIRGFPGVSAWHALERLGAGPHVNGDVGLFETKYYFHQLPVTESGEPDAVALRIMRSIADGVKFAAPAIAAERGVVFGEMRSRDAMLARVRADETEFIAPRERDPRWPEITSLFEGTRLAERQPLGEEATLTAATGTRLRAFYDRWYRPERMILVVAGDIAVDRVEDRIRNGFSSLAGRGQAPVEPVVPVVQNPGRLQLVGRPEPAMLVSLGVARVWPGPDYRERRFHAMARRLALSMLVDRLNEAIETGTAPFFSIEAFSSHYVPNQELVLVRARTRSAEWKKALHDIDLEVRRINEQGFTPSEFQRAIEYELVRATAAARQAGHQSSANLATALAVTATRGVVFTSAADELELVRATAANLDASQCHAAFRDMLASGEWSMAIIGPFEGEGEHTVSFHESRTSKLTPYVPPPAARRFPFTDFGPAGVVVRHERSAETDTDLIEFANGVRLNLKRTRFQPGQLQLALRIDGVRLACLPDKPDLELHSFAWLVGGLDGVAPHELTTWMRGTMDKQHFSISPLGFHLGSQIATEKLMLTLQLGAAFFSRPAFRPESSNRAIEMMKGAMAPFTSTADGAALLNLWYRMTGQHPAYRPMRYEGMAERTPDEVRAWSRQFLASAPLEVAAVGDFDPALVIDACARTLGALPARAAGDPWKHLRRVSFPPKQFTEEIAFTGSKSVAVAAFGWPAPEATQFPDRFRAEILARILNSRLMLRLRTELGETYSSTTALETSRLLDPDVTFVRCSVEADPERLVVVARATRAVALALQRGGATADEFERARQGLLRDAEAGLQSNEWWLDLVGVAQSNPGYGAAWSRAVQHYQSTTLAEVNALAARVFAPERCCQLLVRPSASAEIAGPE